MAIQPLPAKLFQHPVIMCCQVVVKQAEVCRYKQKDKHEDGKKNWCTQRGVWKSLRSSEGQFKWSKARGAGELSGSEQGSDVMHGETRDAGDQHESNKQICDEWSRTSQHTLQVSLVQDSKSSRLYAFPFNRLKALTFLTLQLISPWDLVLLHTLNIYNGTEFVESQAGIYSQQGSWAMPLERDLRLFSPSLQLAGVLIAQNTPQRGTNSSIPTCLDQNHCHRLA